jgi:hypothetical protein
MNWVLRSTLSNAAFLRFLDIFKMKFVAVILISLALAAVLANATPDNDNNLPEDYCHGNLRSPVGNLCAGKNQVSLFIKTDPKKWTI